MNPAHLNSCCRPHLTRTFAEPGLQLIQLEPNAFTLTGDPEPQLLFAKCLEIPGVSKAVQLLTQPAHSTAHVWVTNSQTGQTTQGDKVKSEKKAQHLIAIRYKFRQVGNKAKKKKNKREREF